MFNIYATDYAPVDPITPPCDITPIFIGYKGENKARCLIFDLTECVETFGDGGFVISFIRQGDDLPYLVTDTDRLDNNAIWIITDTDTAVDGYGMVQLQYIVDDVVCKSALYRTVTFDSNGITGDVPDPYEDLLAQIAAYAAQAEGAATTATAAAQSASTAVEEGVKTERSQRIAADEGLNTRINELMGLAGAPSMANSAAAMTDSSKVYVYTGSEAGYLMGHWYYYNGTEWTDGGVYQATAINTDKTLTVENMAADAAVVGERIDECMAAFVVESTSGSIASFTDGADGVPLKDLVVNIQPNQSGTGDPSPSNVRAISGYTGANIYRTGINIWDGSWTLGGLVWTTGAEYPGTDRIRTGFIKIKPNTTYYVYVDVSGFTTGGYVIYDANKERVSSNSGLSFNATIVTGASAEYIRFVFQGITSFTNGISIYESDPAINGTEVPVDADTYNISFGSAGTVYGGTLDVTSGMLTATHGYVDLGTLSWSYSSSDIRFYTTQINAIGEDSSSNDPMNCVATMYKPIRYNQNKGSSVNFRIGGVRVGSTTYVNITNTSYTDPAAFKAAMSGSFLAYELVQPVSYQLTPTEVKSLLGNNNIFADTGSVASCEYRADTRLYIEKLTNPDDDMVANANITSGSYFMVNNNLYLATANIANGGAITPGTNCTLTNLAAALNAINS